MSKIINVVLLGPPGAGKGTQAKRLVDRYPLVHLSSGDMLRAERAAGSELGSKVTEFMDSGKLVPDALVTEVVISQIMKVLASGEKGVLLDGFPRTLNQAKDLDKALAADGTKIDVAVDLLLDPEVIVDRMAGRRSCSQCGRVYHMTANPPKDGTNCDDCKVPLVQRVDDKEDVVRNRLSVYTEQTAPLEDYFQAVGILSPVDAGQDIDSVTDQMTQALDRLLEK
jgi:adenylate kinase